MRWIERASVRGRAWRHPSSASLAGLVHTFVHQRLVMVYARLGRLAEAEAHLAVLERECTRPDPDVRLRLDEARAAVRSARGMAEPERART